MGVRRHHRDREKHTWSWAELLALPTETPTVDIHCVTKWSKLGTTWQGVRWTPCCDVETAADFALAHSYGGYTTNLPLEDLLDGQAWIAYGYEGERPGARARRPGAAARAAPVLLEVGQVGPRHPAAGRGRARLLGDRGYHDYGDPWREQRYQGD